MAASFAPAEDASNGITAAAAGALTREYNAGLGMYFLVWGIMCAIYFVASLRTYVGIFLIFLFLLPDLEIRVLTQDFDSLWLVGAYRNIPFAIVFLCKFDWLVAGYLI